MLTTLTNCIITAYCATGMVCANGKFPSEHKTIATASRSISFGSTIKISGIKQKFVVEDRTNKRFQSQNRFDIFFGTNISAAKKFGKQIRDVTIITP